MCVVTPSSLRKGVAAQLMTRVITEATTRGLSCVYAYVRADNKVTTVTHQLSKVDKIMASSLCSGI